MAPDPIRVLVTTGISLFLGLLLVTLLGKATGLRLGELVQRIAETHYAFVALILASTVLHIWLTAFKWRLVTARLSSQIRDRRIFLRYTALITILAQIFPLLLSTIATRSVALRRHEEMPLQTGAASTIYDQCFDLLVPLLLFLPAILYLQGWVSGFLFWLSLAAVLVCAGIAILLLGTPLVLGALRVLASLPVVGARFDRMVDNLVVLGPRSLLSGPMMAILFGLSVLRFSNLAVRLCLVVPAAGLDLPLVPIVVALPVILMSFLISITPGALGIVEWGWVGMLGMMRIPGSAAAEFAIMARVLHFSSAISGALIVLALSTIRASFRTRSSRNPRHPRLDR